MKLSKNLLVVALAAACLSACHAQSQDEAAAPSSQAAQPTQVALDPAKVCIDSDSQQAVEQIIGERAQKYAHGLDAQKMLNDDDQLSHLIRLEDTVVEKYDPTTKKVTCQAQFSLNVPDDLKPNFTEAAIGTAELTGNGRLKTIELTLRDSALLEGGQRELIYTVQPTADGTSNSYEIEDIVPPARALGVLADAESQR